MSRHDPRPDVALVFVHGLFGDTLGTWGDGRAQQSFFELIEQDPDIGPKVDVYAFGYSSRMLRSGSLDIQEAANRLQIRFEDEDILDYPAIVFVAHSMGGLVVMQQLLTRRDMLPKVPVILLYATPQEGSQITEIARHVANNQALEQMLPADRNGYLRTLNDQWRALPPELRPTVRCGYEKRPTRGVMVVPWESATRFCEGTTLAIDADHIGIVKPDRHGHDSYVLLSTVLKKFVLGTQLQPLLETPDFTVRDDRAILRVSDPTIERSVRLVNAGGGQLRYTLAEFPDTGLYVIPGMGPDLIEGGQTKSLTFVLGYGATASQYHFLLKTNASSDLPVTIQIENMRALQELHNQLADSAADNLATYLRDPQGFEALRARPSGDPEARESILRSVQDAIESQQPELSEAGTWLITAELLNAVNWPNLALDSLANLQRLDRALLDVPSVRQLAGRTAALAGEQRVLGNIEAVAIDPDQGPQIAANPWTANQNVELIADRLQDVETLRAEGFSLEGDLRFAQGDQAGAEEAYRMAAEREETPSVRYRMTRLSHDSTTRAPRRELLNDRLEESQLQR